MKLKTKECTEGRYHHIFNNVLESSSELLRSNTHKGCCVLNTTDYNYKLRSVIGREDDSKVTKWTWFNKQVRDTFLCSWMISRKMVDHTNIGRAIGRILNMVYAPSVSSRDSIGSATSLTQMVHIPYQVYGQWLFQYWCDQPTSVISSMNINMCHALVY